MARRGEHALANVVFGDEEGGAGALPAVLRTVGQKCLLASLDVVGDIDDKGGANVGVERGVQDLKRTMGCAVLGWEIQTGQPGSEAGLVAEGGGGVVVRVATLPVGENDDPWAQTTEDGRDLQPISKGVFHVAVGQVERLAMVHAQETGGGIRFGGALGCGTAGATFAPRQVEDAGTPAQGMLHQQSSAAGLFHVVAMRGDGEDVDGGERGRHGVVSS